MINLDRDLQKHSREFSNALATRKFEQMEDGGIFFPAQRAIAHGLYVHDVNGLDVQYDPNILPTEGLTHMLAVEFGATAKISAWYLALYASAVTPGATLTAATFTSVTGEITSGSEGYTETTRQLFVPGTAAAASIDNNASKVAYTIITATQLTVNGCGMLSASAKGATTGTLASASRFTNPRLLSNGDIFNIGYAVSLTSS